MCCRRYGESGERLSRVQGGYLMQLYLDLCLSIKRKDPPFRQASEETSEVTSCQNR
jgi:hypothetical protein